MTLERARVLKGAPPVNARPSGGPSSTAEESALGRARRIDAQVARAREEAARIVEEAHARAADVADAAAREAREQEVARLAAAFLALRAEDERRAERELERVIELATLLAERLVGEAIRVEPARVTELAAAALRETRGARRVRIDAAPEDVPALTDALGAIGHAAEIHPDVRLTRGSLVVHTDLGAIDARLEPQLTRLAAALREALR